MPRGSVSRDRTVGRFTPYDTVSNDEHLVGRPQPNLPPSRPTNPPHSPDPTDDPHLFSDDELDDSRRYPRGSRPVPTSPSETTSGSGSRSPRSPLEEALAAASAERNSPPSDDAKSSRRRNRPAAGEAETSAGSEGRQFGRKKNVCSDCDKSFSTAGHLQRHRRLHSGVRDFRCPIKECLQTFTRRDNMVQHFKSHMSPTSRSHIKLSESEATPYLALLAMKSPPFHPSHYTRPIPPPTSPTSSPTTYSFPPTSATRRPPMSITEVFEQSVERAEEDGVMPFDNAFRPSQSYRLHELSLEEDPYAPRVKVEETPFGTPDEEEDGVRRPSDDRGEGSSSICRGSPAAYAPTAEELDAMFLHRPPPRWGLEASEYPQTRPDDTQTSTSASIRSSSHYREVWAFLPNAGVAGSGYESPSPVARARSGSASSVESYRSLVDRYKEVNLDSPGSENARGSSSGSQYSPSLLPGSGRDVQSPASSFFPSPTSDPSSPSFHSPHSHSPQSHSPQSHSPHSPHSPVLSHPSIPPYSPVLLPSPHIMFPPHPNAFYDPHSILSASPALFSPPTRQPQPPPFYYPSPLPPPPLPPLFGTYAPGPLQTFTTASGPIQGYDRVYYEIASDPGIKGEPNPFDSDAEGMRR